MNIYISKRYQLNNSDSKKINDLGGLIHYYETTIDDLSKVNILVDYPEKINNFSFMFENLKFVQILSAGYDKLDVDKFKSKGVILANGRGIHSKPIAEYVLGYILATYKSFDEISNNQRNKLWQRDLKNYSLSNKTILILGTGSIGQEIAKRTKAFEMRVLGVSYSGMLKNNFDACYKMNQLNEVLPLADIIVGALPANTDTDYLLNKTTFELMKEDVVLINIGRGSLINTNDLLEILNHKFKKVILDVFEKEPLSKESPLWDNEKVVITPHISFLAENTDDNIKSLIVENLILFLSKQPIVNQI